MKKVLFVKTTPNHSQMHNRFEGKLKQEHNVHFASLDFQCLLDESLRDILSKFFFDIISKDLLLKIIRRFRPFFRMMFCIYLKNIVQKTISSGKYSAVVLSDNYYSLIHAIIISCCGNLRVKVLCIPYVNQDFEDILISRSNNISVSTFSNGLLSKIVSLKMPEWVSVYYGKKVLWAHPLEIFAISFLGLNIDKPKAGVSNLVDAVLISNNLAKDRFLEYGADERKLAVIGDISFDYVNKSSDKKHRTALFSICPKLSYDCIYIDYDEYIAHFLEMAEVLKNKGFDVIISAHPSVSNETIDKINSSGYVVSERDIIELLFISDVYIASYTSTIVYASLLGVKVLELDIYRLKYVGNKKLSGVIFMENIDELKHAVEKLNFENINTVMESKCELMELFDGRVIDRFIERL